MEKFNPAQKIDSHGSFLSNRMVIVMKGHIDMLGLTASNTLQFRHIDAFFNAVEMWYIGIKDILDKEIIEGNDQVTGTEVSRIAYRKKRLLVEGCDKLRGQAAFMEMLDITKEFYSDIITGLQRKEFFFRMGQRNVKGLRKIQFMNTIFGNDRKQDIEGEGAEPVGESEIPG